MNETKRGFTRRDLIRAGSVAAAGLLLGSKLEPRPNKPLRIDVHAHVWTDDYLNLMDRYGKKDTATQR
ncbi:MAG TPA: twin-arginine translocation signal domain-containing protein, partial [Chloroflexota bacterium]|nr:twin-arginine translocation signal domain-containing protein [Chloroflexota bacterium]